MFKRLPKKTVLTFIFLSLTLLNISIFLNHTKAFVVEAQEQLAGYYDVDNVYSTYSPSTNYTLGGAIYSDVSGVLVRSISTEKVNAGLILPFAETMTITESTAIVIDVMFYSNLTRSMKVEIEQSNQTIASLVNGENIYLSKNNTVVDTEDVANEAYSNCLDASSGYSTNDVSAAYNQLVIPLTSFGYLVGDTVTLSNIYFYAPNWSTSIYNKYLLSSIAVSTDFSPTESFTVSEKWNAEEDSFTEYGSVLNNLDIQILDKGQILMDPSVNTGGNGVLQQLVFKFPDELINDEGYVDTDNISGLTLEFNNGTETSFNGHFKLFSITGDTLANSNYANLKTQKITEDGTVSISNAKYFYSSLNSVGYANSFILYNFNGTETVTENSTESFYCVEGDLPQQISPYFTFNYDDTTSLSLDNVYLGQIRILTSDNAIYQNDISSSEFASVSHSKGYLGNTATFRAEDNFRVVSSVELNGVALAEGLVQDLFSEEGLSLTMTGNMFIQVIFDDELPLDITSIPPMNGRIILSNDQIIEGNYLRIECVANTGYELDWLKVNGVDVTSGVKNNIYIQEITGETNVTAHFKEATEYLLETGSVSSLYNSFPGITWAETDVVNIQTTYDFSSSSEEAYIGVNLSGMAESVDSTDYLVLEVHNMINMWRTFYVTINGIDKAIETDYYLINRFNEIISKNGMGIITESSLPANTLNQTLSTANTEGFYGQIIIPISSYNGLFEINDISIKSLVKDKSYARFNIGRVYLIDEFDSEAGSVINDQDLIWNPSGDTWTSIDETNTFSMVKFMEAGEVVLETVVSNEYGYDALYVSLPQNMVNSDGYVDLEALGVKGIAIDVKNYNLMQHSLAIRIAGSDNISLTDTNYALWQTSISNHPAEIVFPSGLVKSGNSAYIPFDESGDFEGTIYIPFTSIAYTSIGGAGGFPTLIQPLLRILPGSMNNTSYTTYDFYINNIRFITDDSEFETYQITMTQIGGTINATIDGVPVSNNANNHVLMGTDLDVTIIPDNGYRLSSIMYQMGEEDLVYVDLAGEDQFSVNVTQDILIQVICDEIDYIITYDLLGGTNNPNNPTEYTIESSSILLEAPSREGYKFKGWLLDEVSITEITSGSKGDINLTASWEKDTVFVSAVNWIAGLDLWLKVATPVIVSGIFFAIVVVVKKNKSV